MFEVNFGAFTASGNQFNSQFFSASYSEAKEFLQSVFDLIQKDSSMAFNYGEIKQKTPYGVYILSDYQYFNNGHYAFIEHQGPFVSSAHYC